MDNKKPYLIIPKLIEQPTWGGTYIAEQKSWEKNPLLHQKKLGQSYELFSGTNLSLLANSQDPEFFGELTDPKLVENVTQPPHSISLKQLLDENPEDILGAKNVEKFGPKMHLLIKFTQALGNSFQLHIKDGTQNPKWKPKPESWYYFEPGVITLGVKKGVDFDEYKQMCLELNEKIIGIASQVQIGSKSYEDGKQEIDALIKLYNPWDFVNTLYTKPEQLIDLSPCGIHHSWEEDAQKAPLGNIVYELQLDVMDDVATIRNFDKGKMSKQGNLRKLQIEDYFEHIDRSEKANDPETHITQSQSLEDSSDRNVELLLKTQYYQLKKVVLKNKDASFSEKISSFRHIFVKEGSVTITSHDHSLTLTQGHSAFVPFSAHEYEIKALDIPSVALISY